MPDDEDPEHLWDSMRHITDDEAEACAWCGEVDCENTCTGALLAQQERKVALTGSLRRHSRARRAEAD